MRVPHVVFCVCMIGFVVVWFIPAKADPSAGQWTPPTRVEVSKMESEIASLKALVKKVEEKNGELARENEKLKSKLKANQALQGWTTDTYQWGQLQAPPAPQPTIQRTPTTSMPPGAVEREFNGSTYYLVPLGQQSMQAVTPIPSKKSK